MSGKAVSPAFMLIYLHKHVNLIVKGHTLTYVHTYIAYCAAF